MLLAALATAERALPLYSHRNSPKKFTQHQLFACLVLKSFLKTDYRGVVAHLADCPSLVETLGLAQRSSLHDAAKSGAATAGQPRQPDACWTPRSANTWAASGACRARRSTRPGWSRVPPAATSSGVASGVGMPWKTVVYHHFPKLGVVCDVETHFILAAQEGRGPQARRGRLSAAR